ncbi:hypothetical protein C0992_010294 [Termitomyces sp. T32_za158]|nr:hypothetical protein C0992_010294 [Termitomyces sp. T32_za158]
MTGTFAYTFDTPAFKATGKVITSVAAGSSKDVDIAVDVAKKAYKSSWGLKVPGTMRGKLLHKLADLLESNITEFAALESLNVGKWPDNSLERPSGKMITAFELANVVVPQLMVAWKFGPALATGNTIVLKPSEITPLTAMRFTDLVMEAGFPPGVVNIVNGYGPTVGQAIILHPLIEKVAFTGSILVGRKILKASSESNLKVVTLELGGKSPTIIFDDADLGQAIECAASGIL